MMQRWLTQQSVHDRKVAELALGYQRQGWDVSADIAGWPKPPLINGHVPDVYAQHLGRTRIIEVETSESLRADSDQHAAFRMFAVFQLNTEFQIELAT